MKICFVIYAHLIECECFLCSCLPKLGFALRKQASRFIEQTLQEFDQKKAAAKIIVYLDLCLPRL